MRENLEMEVYFVGCVTILQPKTGYHIDFNFHVQYDEATVYIKKVYCLTNPKTFCFVICHSLGKGGGGDLSCIYYLFIIYLLFIYYLFIA